MLVAGQLWWHVARVSGLFSWLLLAASCLWGLLTSTRVLGRRPSRPWLLDMHRFLSALALAALALHLVALILDSYVQFSLGDLLVPMSSPWEPGAVAYGIVAMYLLVVVEVSSLLMHRLPRRLWWSIHLTSLAALTLGTVHGLLSGTDAGNLIVRLVLVVALAEVVFVLGLRIAYRRQRWRASAVE